MDKKHSVKMDPKTLDLNDGDSCNSESQEHSDQSTDDNKTAHSPGWLYIKNFTCVRYIFKNEKKRTIEKKFLEEFKDLDEKFDREMDYCNTLQMLSKLEK